MEHVRTIGAWERESGSAGEAQAFDYIERTLKSYGLEVERRQIEAYISLPLEGRVRLDDGAIIDGLTHSFSPSVDGLRAEVGDVGDGTPAELARAAGKIALVRGLATPGHVDAWHHGAMDNGAANATMLEIARLLATRRDALARGIRFAFWSGHSHGRYAGSAWFADHAWRELHARCVLHLNVDSTGARGATDYSVLHATEDAQSLAETVVADVTGQRGRARRFSRAGDQSFWGAGVPSAFMSLSGLPKQDTELSRAMGRLVGSAGFPWWWHTRDDTVDKIDAEVLALDTKVYLATALRWLNAPVLPLDHRRAARSLLAELEALQAAAGARFDLGPALEAARTLAERLERVAERLEPVEPARAEAVNAGLVRLSRILVPLAYTSGDRFAHDLALPIAPLAGAQRARDLAALDPDGDAFKFARVALVRELNRIVHALDSAITVAGDLLEDWR